MAKYIIELQKLARKPVLAVRLSFDGLKQVFSRDTTKTAGVGGCLKRKTWIKSGRKQEKLRLNTAIPEGKTLKTEGVKSIQLTIVDFITSTLLFSAFWLYCRGTDEQQRNAETTKRGQ